MAEQPMIGPDRKSRAESPAPHRPDAIFHHLVVGLAATATKNTNLAKLTADLRGFLDGVALTVAGFASPRCEPGVTFTIITRELDQ